MKDDKSNIIRIVGLALSIISAIALATLGATSIAMAVVLGLLVAIISLLVDLILSSESVRLDVLDAIGLSKSLTADKTAATYLRTMSVAMEKLSKNGTASEMFYREAVRTLLHCATSLTQLSEGEMTLDEVRRMEALMRLVDTTKSGDSIFVTSYVSIRDWWDTSVGQQYLQANFRAAERGVCIRRVFIVRPDDGAQLRTFVEAQASAVEVRLIKEHLVEPSNRENFLLIEDRILSFADYSREGRLMRGRISISPSALITYNEKFRSLYLSASSLTEFYSH